MMQIISHRGFWIEQSEKNTFQAFERSFEKGYGTETDIRDHDGEIVISHDPADANSIGFQAYLNCVSQYQGKNLIQALNIKADGLAQKLAQAMKGFSHPWFVFDMSIPDTLQHIKAGNPVYARMSEYEPFPEKMQNHIQGIWLDAFDGIWFNTGDIQSILSKGLGVCIVSPELHGRKDYVNFWHSLKPLKENSKLTLCTDLPLDASAVLSGI